MNTQTDMTQIGRMIDTYALPLAWKVLAALALWTVGGWIVRLIRAGALRAMKARDLDATLSRYVDTSLGVLLKILLVIAILGSLGVETTSFAAILAAAGVAIGIAWSGLLAHFAAGIFLVILRPFRVGDFVSAGGVTGFVRELGLFATTIHTPDNLRVTIGNNKIFADTIVNYSATEFRAVDLRAQVAHGVDPNDAIAKLRARVAAVPNVIAEPAPLVEIFEFNAMGTLLVVRPFAANEHYWQVYFDTNRAIQRTGADAGWPAPEQRTAMRSIA